MEARSAARSRNIGLISDWFGEAPGNSISRRQIQRDRDMRQRTDEELPYLERNMIVAVGGACVHTDAYTKVKR